MLEQEDYGPVQALRQGRRVLGIFPPYLWVRCFAVDGLLVDAGLIGHASRTLAWAREQRVHEAVVTHHHEDHSGGGPELRAAGFPVRASKRTRAWVGQGFAVRFYQQVAWGGSPKGELDPLGETLETDHFRFQVLPAPGHCDDQVVLYEPDQGWLFSGDAFLAERVKLFRSDEDFTETLRSLERLVELDFSELFCAHRPVLGRGREALRGKLQHLLELEGRVRDLNQRGRDLDAITHEVLGPESRWLYLFSGGDLSKRNLVRSILHGPQPRRDAPEVRSPA